MAETPQASITTNINLAVRNETSLESYIKIISYGDICSDPTMSTSTEVNVYVGGVYNITYWDADQQAFVTNKNIHITSVSASYIKGQFIQDNCPQECLCANRDDLYNYITAVTVTIPLSNINKIVDVATQSEEEICKEVTKVSILGISTEFIRSVIVTLRIY